MLTKLKYLQPPSCWEKMPGKCEIHMAVFASSEEVVSWLSHYFDDVPHLEKQYIESANVLNQVFGNQEQYVRCNQIYIYRVTYHLILAINCEWVPGNAQEDQHTAETPHVNGL